jgi:hypothetical protein
MSIREENFENILKLKYSKSELLAIFNKEKEKSIRNYIKPMTISIFIASLVSTIQISFLFSHYSHNNFKLIMIFSYAMTLIYMGLTASIFLRFQSKKLLLITNYINYFCLLFVFIDFGYPLIHFVQVNHILFYCLVSIEIVVRLIPLGLMMYNFKEFLILNVMTIFAMWALYGPVGDPKTLTENMLFLTAYTGQIIVVITYSYFLIKNQGNTLNCMDILNKKLNWFKNVLENSNAGYISIADGHVSYMNNFLIEKFSEWKDYQSMFPSSILEGYFLLK